MSMISFLEILVRPKMENNIFIENRYKLMLTNYPNLLIVNVEYKIADISAKLKLIIKLKRLMQ